MVVAQCILYSGAIGFGHFYYLDGLIAKIGVEQSWAQEDEYTCSWVAMACLGEQRGREAACFFNVCAGTYVDRKFFNVRFLSYERE